MPFSGIYEVTSNVLLILVSKIDHKSDQSPVVVVRQVTVVAGIIVVRWRLVACRTISAWPVVIRCVLMWWNLALRTDDNPMTSTYMGIVDSRRHDNNNDPQLMCRKLTPSSTLPRLVNFIRLVKASNIRGAEIKTSPGRTSLVNFLSISAFVREMVLLGSLQTFLVRQMTCTKDVVMVSVVP